MTSRDLGLVACFAIWRHFLLHIASAVGIESTLCMACYFVLWALNLHSFLYRMCQWCPSCYLRIRSPMLCSSHNSQKKAACFANPATCYASTSDCTRFSQIKTCSHGVFARNTEKLEIDADLSPNRRDNTNHRWHFGLLKQCDLAWILQNLRNG